MENSASVTLCCHQAHSQITNVPIEFQWVPLRRNILNNSATLTAGIHFIAQIHFVPITYDLSCDVHGLVKKKHLSTKEQPFKNKEKKKTRFIMSGTFKEPIWDKMKRNHQAVKTVTLTPFSPAINMWSVSLLFSLDRETTCCNQNMINPLVYFLLSKLLDKTLYIKILAWWASHYQLIILWLRKLHPRNLQIQCRNRYWMRLRSCCPITGGRGL